MALRSSSGKTLSLYRERQVKLEAFDGEVNVVGRWKEKAEIAGEDSTALRLTASSLRCRQFKDVHGSIAVQGGLSAGNTLAEHLRFTQYKCTNSITARMYQMRQRDTSQVRQTPLRCDTVCHTCAKYDTHLELAMCR
jgi:hypothetical protein